LYDGGIYIYIVFYTAIMRCTRHYPAIY